MADEQYLDGLIASISHKDPHEFFAQHNGKLKHDLYHLVIKPKLASALPKEDFYVANEEKVFEYHYGGGKFHITATRHDERNGNGGLRDVSRSIGYKVNEGRISKKITLVNGLFLNKRARINFEEGIKTHGLKSRGTRDIEVRDYGIIKLYTYATT